MAIDPEIKKIDFVEWRQLASSFADHNYRQLYEYSSLAAERIGATSENVAIWHGQELKGLANIRIKRIPFTSKGVAYINGGPLIKHVHALSEQEQSLTKCLVALRQEYVNRRGLLLRIICPVSDCATVSFQSKVFESLGFKKPKAKGKYRTILIDLLPPVDSIRKGLAQKWRNILNKAEKNNIQVTRSKELSSFDDFLILFDNLVERKRISVDLGPSFFRDLQKTLPEHEKFVVHLAIANGKPVAGHIGSYLGDTAVYLLGAANDEGLKLNASYLLQWNVILYARESGCRWYDLGGIDPESNPDVYRFKQRMGGEDITAAGPYEATSLLSGSMIHLAENTFNLIKALR